jgi:nitroimidazol reductase NimA-like FMN-containing flavoprotein (pyridoxamine 5'-phosphate oxidase superfamily)
VDAVTLRELSHEDCLRLLETTVVGRLARNDPAGPTVVPVNFVVHRGGVLIRSVLGGKLRAGKLRAAEQADPVSFEADGLDVAHRSGWSVLVRGRLQILDEAFSVVPVPDSFIAAAGNPLLWLDAAEITGRRLPVHPTTARSWDEVTELGNVWFGRDGTDLLS